MPYASLRVGCQMTVGLSTTAIFDDLVATALETLEIRPAILHGAMHCRLVIWLQNEWHIEWPWVLYFMSKSVFDLQGCRTLTSASARLSIFYSSVNNKFLFPKFRQDRAFIWYEGNILMVKLGGGQLPFPVPRRHWVVERYVVTLLPERVPFERVPRYKNTRKSEHYE